MNHNLFKIVSANSLSSSKDIYRFLAKKIAFDNVMLQNEIIGGLEERERLGNIMIAEGVVLPHYEGKGFDSQVFIVLLQEPIKEWQEGINNVRIIIAILLSEDTTLEIKKKIQIFVRKLADEENIKILLSEEKEKIQELIE